MNIIIILLITIIFLILLKQFKWNETFIGLNNPEDTQLLLDEYNMLSRINLQNTQLIPYRAYNDYADKHKEELNKLIYKQNTQGKFIVNENGEYELKDSITNKYLSLQNKLLELKNKNENLSKRIHPKFKFPSTFRIKKYDSNNYLTLKIDDIDDNKFNILLNNGNCLNMGKQNIFNISECINVDETERENQQFTLSYIFTKDDYEKHTLEHNRYPEDINNLDYPIILIKNRYNNCIGYEVDKLTNKLKLSIGPCKYDYKQMWRL